ncbi:MAG: hypothetical protein Q9165_004029 [Trypethelium subeluteriae]
MAHEELPGHPSDTSDSNGITPPPTSDDSTAQHSKAVAFRRDSEDSRSVRSVHSMDGVKENNEFSPLLEPQRDGDGLRLAAVLSPSTDENWEDRDVGAQGEETKSSWYLFLLTITVGGDIVGGFLSLFGADPASKGVKVTAIIWAVLFIYILDFAINVTAVRAFIVDCAPTHQQDDANAWAVKTSGVGNILGYLFGYVNLPKYVPFLGDTQFKCLCAISITVMLGTLAISCTAIKERDPRLDGDLPPYQNGFIAFFKSMSRSIARLPTQISRVCQVQFAAWIGWFPFLFYATTYIGELYVEPFFAENPNMTPEEIDKTWEHATRIGTFALLIWGITTFVASVILPWLIVPAFEPPPKPSATPLTPSSMTASSYFNLPSPPTKPSSPRSSFLRTHWHRLTRLTPSLRIPSLTLRRLWLLSHLLFFACMWLTFLVRSTAAATVLVGLVGIPWAITNWAPFALISAEISKRDAIRRGVLRAPPTRDGELLARGEDDAQGADQAGVVLGIHNVALAAPQVIATLVSSAIFRALQKPRGSVGDESVAWVLRFGGVCALVAAWLTMRVGEEAEDLRGGGGEGREATGRVH